ncbi:unnamed protein product [Orchesella dallaii]|uniref:RNA helicase n=1 Tax=Orchesella dallaii TaxID=48710 RepID=A0ABP1PZX8_9HEXA
MDPQVLLVCSSVTTASLLETSLKWVLDGVGVPFKIVRVDRTNKCNKQMNSADILITNILYVPQLLCGRVGEKSPEILKFDRLQFLVFDEVDAYLEVEGSTVAWLTRTADLYPLQGLSAFQLIICGSKLSPTLRAIYLNLTMQGRKLNLYLQPLAEIMNFVEARWVIDYAPDDSRKIELLKETLPKLMASEVCCTIACSNLATARLIHGVCSDSNLPSKIISSELNEHEIDSDFIYGTNAKILIVTDDMMQEIGFSECTYMLSFDSIERLRLSHIWDALPKLIRKEKWVSKKPVAHFFITGQEPNFLRFFKFLKSLDNSFCDPQLESIGNELFAKESELLPICRGIELFGYCNGAPGTICWFRHELIASDFESVANAPCFGDIEIAITQCLSPSEYIGTLLNHYGIIEGRRELLKSFINEMDVRDELLQKFYTVEANLKRPSTFKKGFIYGLRVEGEQTYKRVKYIGKLGVKTGNSDPAAKSLNLYCVDSGEEITGVAKELFTLPLEYASWPPLTLKVILTNICPPDQEPKYFSGQCETAESWIKKSTVRAKVWVSRGETVWVNPMTKLVAVPSSSDYFIRPKLIQYRAASLNSSHHLQLMESVLSLGTNYHGFLNLPVVKKALPIKKLTHEIFNTTLHGHIIKWADVQQSNDTEIHPVDMKPTRCFHPWSFIGTNTKYHRFVTDLENDLSSWVEAGDRNEYEEHFNQLKKGSIVAAKDKNSPYGRWVRAMVQDVCDDGEPLFNVYLVDSGTWVCNLKREDIFPIPTKFVTQLPFQAMAFSLSHIQPKDATENWNVNEIEEFRNLVNPNDCRVVLELAVTGKVDHEKSLTDQLFGIRPPCNYYSVVALLEDEEIGSNLVEKGMATEVYSVSRLVSALKNAMRVAPVVVTSVADISKLIDNNEMENYESDDELQALIDKFEINYGIDPNSQEAVSDIGDDDYSCNPAANLNGEENNESIAVNTPSAPPVAGTSSSFTSEALPIARETLLLHPTIYWHQTIAAVILTIQLPDIKEFKIEIGLDGRTIRCRIIQPKNYGFDLKLFGKVTKYSEFLTGQQLKLVFTKRSTPATWRRLLYDKTLKCHWVKEDPDFTQNSNSSAEEDDATLMPLFAAI